MRHLADVVHSELHWKQPHLFDSTYELVSGDERVATLEFRSTFGSFATAQTGDVQASRVLADAGDGP
jgi:hypothetical protein